MLSTEALVDDDDGDGVDEGDGGPNEDGETRAWMDWLEVEVEEEDGAMDCGWCWVLNALPLLY